MLLLTIITGAASPRNKGIGCWRTAKSQQTAMARLASPSQKPRHTCYHGRKRGLIILAEFTNMQFKNEHTPQKYNDILNAEGYTTDEGFRGSVADYFRDQSGGLFEMVFDVVGPYTTKNDYKYYGENDEDGYDLHPEEMIMEMCRAANADVDFADYDWDGDGEVDEVFVIYAGKGEADSNNKNTIWPHMWSLTEIGKKLKLDGMVINVYACSSELKGDGTIDGIGSICHEFSHCLGLPDFYDTLHGKEFGMSDFDVMDGGCYSGNGFTPVGYTAYEKMVCGWQEPIVLANEDVTVDSLRPMSEQGDTYILYNDAHPDEYYLIENRQKTGWDADYPSRGLMITHVDYDERLWIDNVPNSIYTKEQAKEEGISGSNDHQRMTIFHADGNDSRWLINNDLYPYTTHDSLTATSKPAATLWNENSEGTKLMQGAILHIKQRKDGTVAFQYRAKQPIADAIVAVRTPRSDRKVYTLDGRVAGTAVESLRRGIYIVDGKKVVR